ncbi:MAG: type II secretion system protein GspC [bacterium]
MNPRTYFLKYSFVLNLVFIFLIALVAADVGNTYLMHRLVGATESVTVEVEELAVESAGYNPATDEILSRNLFGAVVEEETETPEVAAGDTSEIEETPLRLELIGVVYEGDDHPRNFATIKNLTEQEINLYRKDSAITENAKVKRIERDRVLIIRDGELEELRFPKKKSGSVASNRPRQVHKARPDKGRGNKRGGRNNITEGIEEVAPGEYRLKRDAIKDALAPENLSDILTQARTIPNRKRVDGKTVIDGFRIYRIRPKSVFDKLGLQNGDIIKSINGQYLDNLDTALNMLQTLRSQDEFSMNIERRRKEQKFQYEVED